MQRLRNRSQGESRDAYAGVAVALPGRRQGPGRLSVLAPDTRHRAFHLYRRRMVDAATGAIRQRAGSNNSSSQDDDSSSSSVYIHKASCPILANRLRKLNAMSVSGAPASRNLKKATWEMNRVCNGLGLSCQVAERSAYFYRKALQKSLIKGRSISGFVVAFIYLACKERMITSDDRRGKQGCRRRQAVCDALLQDSCWRDAHRAPITDPFRNITKISARDGIEERVSRREREILSSVAAIGRLWARTCLCWRLLPCTLRPWSMGSTSPRQ